MTHDAAWYRNQMNTMETQLTPTDKAWFDELREYTTLAGLMRDETAINAQLFAMMSDLVAAEQDGVSAESLFGQAPKEMADALIKQLPPARWQTNLGLVGITFGITWAFQLIGGSVINGKMVLNLLTFLAVPALTIVVIFGLLALIRSQIYATARLLRSKVGGFLVLWALLAAYIGAVVAMAILMPPLLVVTLSLPWALVVVGIATLTGSVLLIRLKDRLFWPQVFMVMVLGAITALQLVWHEFHFWPRTTATTAVLVIIGVSFLVYVGWSRRLANNH